jgi:ribosome biogenesis ATPase
MAKGGGTKKLSGGVNQTVDPKLTHLLRKLLSSHPQENDLEIPTSIEDLIELLKEQHREYQRKDQTWLHRQVEKSLAVIQQRDTSLSATSKSKVPTPGKRSLDEALQMEEEKYEIEARNHDAIQASCEEVTASVMSLNVGLREKYKRQQEVSDQKAAEEASIRKQQQDLSTKTLKRVKRRKVATGTDSFSTAHSFLTPVSRPNERYQDLGGMADILQQIRQLIEYPLLRPELYHHLGVDPPRGVLLRGPPGCGKSHLANAIGGQLGLPFFRVAAPELVAGMSGESEERIRSLFQTASDMAPSIIFLDELDAIAPKRGGAGDSRGMEKRMVAQLLTSLDRIAPAFNRNQAAVIVLGATNRPDAMDPALRRAGRFDKEIILGVPDEAARCAILKTMTRGMRLSGDFDFKKLARLTPGYVGADVRSLTKEAAVIAINRIFRDVLSDQVMPSQHLGCIQDACREEESMVDMDTQENESSELTDPSFSLSPLTSEDMAPLYVTMDDFLEAIPLVQPSSKREGFATVPGVSWDDIGALTSVREELTLSVLEPIRNPEKFAALGLSLPAGVLLYGPPGCGKTLLAKAIANESGCNFLSVKGPELLDKYVGESERAVRMVFERARSSSPCVVFFDELDSLCPRRGSDGGGGGGVSERVVNQLLTEMDGLESRRSVFVIAATNRPELIDPAMLRPGRLDKLLYVPLPTAQDRSSILSALACSKIQLSEDVDLREIGESSRADGFSGADCAALLREAGLAVLKQSMENPETELRITRKHFEYAFDHVMPSVSKKDQANYEKLRDRLARARCRTDVTVSTSNNDSSGIFGSDKSPTFC